jgi:hypothetical protein
MVASVFEDADPRTTHHPLTRPSRPSPVARAQQVALLDRPERVLAPPRLEPRPQPSAWFDASSFEIPGGAQRLQQMARLLGCALPRPDSSGLSASLAEAA